MCRNTALKVNEPDRVFFMSDHRYMERALALAEQGKGRTSPNPMVGCVIVQGDQILGEGFHVRAGEPHAEVMAVRDAGGSIAGTTVYVNLEPCAHEGRTPPCVDLLLKQQPSRVVVAMVDPNPKVAGRGVDRLREAGITVDVGLLEDQAKELNEAFIKNMDTKTPFVVAKCGMTLDGKIATSTGDSKWVTGEASRRMVHQLRDQVDAILVGSRTLMLDDPGLTTRLEEGRGKDPVRIILDASEYLDKDRKVFHVESDAPTWVVVSEDRDYPFADEVIRVPRSDEGVDMNVLLQELGQREITSVLIEGGGTTHASAFEAGVVDKLYFFIAPKIVGGHDAVSPVDGRGIPKMADAIALEKMSARQVGEDVLIEAYVKK
jgi:diaminohydroxyphosphoribosylaminopyrimidine deaminase/5-amino-6-(5-phosphoribosylamino)uracil reductase